MKAKTLNQAMQNLNEQSSLVFDREDFPTSASPDFYVSRPHNPLDELKTYILNSPANDKILFSGHLGSGKSTELNRFANDTEIKRRFFVLKYSISEVLNILDIDYMDFLLSLAACLYTRSLDAGIRFDSGTLDRVSQWIAYFKEGAEDLQGLGQGKTKKARVSHFFRGIITILLRELTLREAVRNAVKRNINQLVEIINALVTEIRVSLKNGKDLLIIIDDLEKIPDILRADQLFVQAGTYMTTPECKIIYTVPIALYYSLRFQQMASIFSNRYFLPNIKVRERKRDTKARDSDRIDPTGCMVEFLTKRMEQGLIDKDATDMAIINSAGVAREFVRILKMSCTKALTRKQDHIAVDTVSAVITDLRNEYDRGMEKRHYAVLQSVERGEPTDDQATLMELFHAKVLLEYQNGEKWTAINPIVLPLLNKRL